MNIDSVSAGQVVDPSSVEELADFMRTEPGTISPVGAGTELTFGNPLESVDCVVGMRGLRRITEYNPSDLTIHAEAGTSLGELRDALGAQNQMLPLDPWNGDQATIGGVVATNAQGPLRTLGSVRDWIIGMKVVHADGRVTRTGGRVVKNVSGYDLGKLYTGALGSLAIIAEISFKVQARWQTTATAHVRLDDADEVVELLRELREGPLQPVSLVWSGPDHDIYVRFGEHQAAVDWQMENLPAGDWTRYAQEEEQVVWGQVREAYRRLQEPVVRVATLPSKLTDVIRRFRPAGWLAHAAAGIVLMSLPAREIPVLRQEYPALICRAPLEVRRQVPTFGLKGTEYELMRRIKSTFDPDCRLNPGRHVDGEHRS